MIQIQGIANQTGKKFWRSLEELSNTPKFQKWVAQEFPEGAADVLDGKSRRNFLQLMAASMGLAGLTACRRPVEKILPYAKSVEGVVMGNSLHFATAMPFNGGAMGLVVESFDGRPIKIEGNPNHPESRGAAGTFAQASVLNLYDPDRSKEVLEGGKPSTWDAFTKAAATLPADGDGVRILSTLVGSPTLAGVRTQVLAKMPKAKWVEYEALTDEAILEGSQIAFGDVLRPQYDFKKAAVVVALDSDFLELDGRSSGWVKDFSAGRKPMAAGEVAAAPAAAHGAPAHGAPAAGEHATPPPAAEHAAPAAAAHGGGHTSGKHSMNRLYSVESNFTLTGVMADNRLRMKPSEIQSFAFDLARELQAIAGLKVLGQENKWVAAIAKDLNANRGKSIVLAGPRQPAAVHAVVALINQALGNAETVQYTKDVRRPLAAVKELVDEMNSGAAKAVVILGGNPVYDAPADFAFGEALKKVPTSIHLGAEVNETAVLSKWHLPESHYLESWGDAVSSDGTAALVQPLIEPIFPTKSAVEVAGFLAAGKWPKGFDLVKAQWKLDDAAWRKSLHDGVVAGSAPVYVKAGADKTRVEAAVNAAPKTGGELEVVFFPSSNMWDGRYTNNAWLQEAPDPMTKLVWDNAALMSPKTAKKLQVEVIPDDVGMYAQKITVTVGGQKVEAPVYVLPGHADNVVTLMTGYGRSAIGRVGRGIGYNAFAVRTSTGMGFTGAASVAKASGTHYMVSTQEHHTQEGRPIVQEASLTKFDANNHFAKEEEEHIELFSLFQEHDYSQGNQWGMVIDLNACTGCNACLVACQSENNIPVVGKEQVGRGREMHWIRLDRYFTGDEEDPQAVYQPMACQQCENAPCESVCPVAATVHSPEGLNDMAYNRCVGTRYCANNCPYKVRRFNYLNFHKDIDELTKMVHNPDVSVRMRGVMEKCNYCVQRIQEAKIKAKAEGRASGAAGPYKVGEILTACQQSCAADAIVFGNINDPESKVSQLRKDHRNYSLLHELNVKPRTTYLAKLRNPNPELA